MLFAAHTIAGGVMGSYLNNPFLAFLLGIVLHFILDAIPHFDTTDDELTFRQYCVVFGDIAIAFIIIFYFLKPPFSWNSAFFWGAFGGILPDIFDNIPLWKRQFRATGFGKVFHKFHEAIQPPQPGIFIGILTQIVVIAIAVYFYLT